MEWDSWAHLVKMLILSCMSTSNEWKVVDNPLGTGVTLCIVIILLKKNVYDLSATIKKMKTYKCTQCT